jgi:hypothetical protein
MTLFTALFATQSFAQAPAEGLSASSYFVDDPLSTAWTAGKPFVFTNQEPPCDEDYPGHVSMATDSCMPDAVLGGEAVDLATRSSSEVYLFDTYVEVLCGFCLY